MIVDEWHASGDASTDRIEFGQYHFIYRSDDSRWCGTAAEQAAREFVKRCLSETDPAKRWRDGPRLFHRTVTYSDLAPVPVEQETSA
jgi:hypothetical protein